MSTNELNRGSFESLFTTLIEEVKLYYGEEFVDINLNSNQLSIIIHFPAFMISNGIQSRPIYDLYAYLTFTHEDVAYEYARTTFSEVELSAGYLHSHAHRMPIIIPWGDSTQIQKFKARISSYVCLGYSTPLASTLDAIKTNILSGVPIDAFLSIQLVQAIDTAVRWESLEGGPYIGFGNLPTYSKSNFDTYNKASKPVVKNGAAFLQLAPGAPPTLAPTFAINLNELSLLLAQTIIPYIPKHKINYATKPTPFRENLIMDVIVDCTEEEMTLWCVKAIKELKIPQLLFYLFVNSAGFYMPPTNNPLFIKNWYLNLNEQDIPLLSFKGETKYLRVYIESTDRNNANSPQLPKMQLFKPLVQNIYDIIIYFLTYERINSTTTRQD